MINQKNIQTNHGNFIVKEYKDKYVAYQPNLGGILRTMYDFGKDGKLDMLGGGPKGFASKVFHTNSIDQIHQDIYTDLFFRL